MKSAAVGGGRQGGGRQRASVLQHRQEAERDHRGDGGVPQGLAVILLRPEFLLRLVGSLKAQGVDLSELMRMGRAVIELFLVLECIQFKSSNPP